MKLDETFAREIKKQANGDGSREAKFAFKKKVCAACDDLSNPSVMENFNSCMSKHGRVPVSICLAMTILKRADRLEKNSVDWAREVMKLYTNAPLDRFYGYIDDNLHPSRIEEYAGSFIRLTTEQ